MSINVMIFAGNVGGDMEIRATPVGKVIGQFNVAVNQGWGENQKTNWVTCKMFNDRAEKIAPYVKKGMLVTVSGQLSIDEWEKDGINDVQLPKHGSTEQPTQNPVPQSAEGQKRFDEEIPF